MASDLYSSSSPYVHGVPLPDEYASVSNRTMTDVQRYGRRSICLSANLAV
jgi:hypothetical protein